MMSLMPPKLTSQWWRERGGGAQQDWAYHQLKSTARCSMHVRVSLSGLSFFAVLMNAHIKLHLSSLSVSDATNGFPSPSLSLYLFFSLSLCVPFSLCFLAAYENIIRYSPRTVNERSLPSGVTINRKEFNKVQPSRQRRKKLEKYYQQSFGFSNFQPLSLPFSLSLFLCDVCSRLITCEVEGFLIFLFFWGGCTNCPKVERIFQDCRKLMSILWPDEYCSAWHRLRTLCHTISENAGKAKGRGKDSQGLRLSQLVKWLERDRKTETQNCLLMRLPVVSSPLFPPLHLAFFDCVWCRMTGTAT